MVSQDPANINLSPLSGTRLSERFFPFLQNSASILSPFCVRQMFQISMKSLLLNPNLCCEAQPSELNNGNWFLLWLWCSRGVFGEGNAKFLTRKVFPSLAFQQLLEGGELQAPCQALCLYECSLFAYFP